MFKDEKIIDKDDSGIVTLTTSDAIGSVTLFGAEGYINGIDTLNNECLQYATPDATEVRCMNLEDLKKLCKRFQSPDDQDSIESLEKMDIEEFVQRYTGSSSDHGRYAVYSTDTPGEIENITVNGATYYAVKTDGKFLAYDDENGVTHTATSFTSGEGGYKEPKYNSVTGKAEPVLVSVDKTFLPCAEKVGEIIGDRSFILATRYVCPAQQGGDFGMLGCFGANLVDMWNFLYSLDEYEDISIESPYHPIVKTSVKALQNPIYQIRVGDFVNYIDEGTPAELQGNWRVLEKGNDGTIKLYLDSKSTYASIEGWNHNFEYYLGVTRCVTINKNQLMYDTDISLTGSSTPMYFLRNNDIYTVWKTIDSNYELDLEDMFYIRGPQ